MTDEMIPIAAAAATLGATDHRPELGRPPQIPGAVWGPTGGDPLRLLVPRAEVERLLAEREASRAPESSRPAPETRSRRAAHMIALTEPVDAERMMTIAERPGRRRHRRHARTWVNTGRVEVGVLDAHAG
jgi:hypothetical protein